jgi:sugar phosphate isomerase/epimerase
MTKSPLETAVMFWAGRDPAETLSELTSLGIQSGQLGIPGDLDLACAPQWRDALASARFRVYTVFAAYKGESYADIPTVKRTVGFIPPATRAERERRTREVSDFAAAISIAGETVPGIATHIGFVPESAADPDYQAVRDMVRRICDHAAGHHQTFALETGQEPAHVLLAFLNDVGRPNLGINFDPANMILYGTGDPIEALSILGPRVLSVHAKDGDWPDPAKPGSLGKEQPLGAGAVGITRFVRKLQEIGYSGPLAVEREASDPVRRLRDIESAVILLARTFAE